MDQTNQIETLAKSDNSNNSNNSNNFENSYDSEEEINWNESYVLNIITQWLKNQKMTDYKYSSNFLSSYSIYNTGICLTLNQTYGLSIQTDSRIAGPYFCETALINEITGKICYVTKLGYWDVVKHSQPSDLFDHIVQLKNKLETIDMNDLNASERESPDHSE